MAFSSMTGACKMASLLVVAAGWAGSITAAFDVGLCATLNTASMDKSMFLESCNETFRAAKLD